VCGITDVPQMKIHTAEPLVHEPSPFEIEMAIENLKTYELLSIDYILTELVQSKDEILFRDP
jgi:hypothetical protein